MQEDVDRAKKGGFDAHLTKPVNLQKLEATMWRLFPMVRNRVRWKASYAATLHSCFVLLDRYGLKLTAVFRKESHKSAKRGTSVDSKL